MIRLDDFIPTVASPRLARLEAMRFAVDWLEAHPQENAFSMTIVYRDGTKETCTFSRDNPNPFEFNGYDAWADWVDRLPVT